jgi:hypothetical protein
MLLRKNSRREKSCRCRGSESRSKGHINKRQSRVKTREVLHVSLTKSQGPGSLNVVSGYLGERFGQSRPPVRSIDLWGPIRLLEFWIIAPWDLTISSLFHRCKCSNSYYYTRLDRRALAPSYCLHAKINLINHHHQQLGRVVLGIETFFPASNPVVIGI